MRIHDISVTLSETLARWPGHRPFTVERVKTFENHGAQVSVVTSNVHAGTHVDAGCHFLGEGGDVATLSLSNFVGPAVVIDVPGDRITGRVLEDLVPAGATRVLCRTRNREYWPGDVFEKDYVALDTSAAEWAARRPLDLVAIDYLSIAIRDDAVPAHRALLGAGVAVLEGVDLSAVTPGDYFLVCLPVKIAGCDGAPARAILLSEAPAFPA